MNNYIYNETPSGNIDGVNKVFTTVNNIGVIEELYVGGVAYRNIVVNGNTITLGDAPSIGITISIDYFIDDITPTTPSDITFLKLIDGVYSKIKQEKTSITYKLNDVKDNINMFLGKSNNKNMSYEITRQYSFNKSDDISVITYDNSGINIGENKKYIPSNGLCLVGDVLFKYSYYTGGVLGGVLGVNIDVGSRINMGYKLPSSVKKISEVYVDGMLLEYSDNREFKGSYYTLISDNNGDRYLFLPPYMKGNIVTVKYNTINTLLVLDDDKVNFPFEYLDVIYYRVAYTMSVDNEDDRYEYFKREYLERYKEYMSYIRKATLGINNSLKSGVLINF